MVGRGVETSLAEYRRKRDFARTPEPDHGAATPNRQLVIQQHYARRLHFDLRLEIGGVLVSWAVTRGPSANPRTRRLAVRTEDHPLSYGNFEGVIPKGQYGGGTVLLWEFATYVPRNGDPAAALAGGELKFESLGARFRGNWVLVRMTGGEPRDNWLLIKERDDFAETDDDLAARFTTGIVSGRSRAEIEGGTPAVAPKAKAGAAAAGPSVPAFVAPQLCAAADRVPDGAQWAFELKYDGYRLMLAVADGTCTVFTRSGLDWSARFPAVVRAAAALPCRSALIDAEAVVLDDKGLSDFPALVAALESGSTARIIAIAFDLLQRDGRDLRPEPYAARKAALKALVGRGAALRYGDYVAGGGAAMLERVRAAGGEGIIAKDMTAPYRSGRGDSWRKIKTDVRTDVLVIGYMASNKVEPWASLLAAQESPQGLVYVGRIGTGYSARVRASLAPLLTPSSKTRPPVVNEARLPRGAEYLAKPFGAEVKFGGWTAGGQMRQARFLAVQGDRPAPVRKAQAPVGAPLALARPAWRITHAQRVQFPDAGISKGEVADYYRRIWPRLAPHLENRPVSLLRVPETIEGEVFFQRHPLRGLSKGIRVFGKPQEEYFALQGEQGLASAVQFGTVEIHGWNAVLPDLTQPDRMVFDLDPAEDVPFPAVREAAFLLRDYLQAAGLASWPLLSGGKGIHLVVPLDKSAGAEDVEFFCAAFAKRMACEHPQQFVATIAKAKRTGKVLIDYLRNRTKATAILPWSVRARPGATIAAPVTWDSLGRHPSPRVYSVRNVVSDDPWPDFWRRAQTLAPTLLALLRKER